MNRVNEIFDKIEKSFTTIELLEIEYVNKKKGEIYFSTLNYHKKKIQNLRRELQNLGKHTFVNYEIIYNQLGGMNNLKQNISLDINLKESEIRSYYERVLGRTIIRIKSDGIPITFGFPSNT